MLLNLAFNVAVIAGVTSHLIFDSYPGFAGYNMEMWSLAFCLTGIPIILMAYHGILYRNEVQVRGYFFYMLICFAAVLVLTLVDLVFTPACENLPSFMEHHVLKTPPNLVTNPVPVSVNSATAVSVTPLQEPVPSGSAWACGVSRYVHILLTIAILSILGYFTHVVNSLCEDLHFASGPELKDLVLNKEAYLTRYQPQNAYCSITENESIHNHPWIWDKVLAASSDFNTNEIHGTSGGTPMRDMDLGYQYSAFGQRFHELQYPPNCGIVAEQEQAV